MTDNLHPTIAAALAPWSPPPVRVRCPLCGGSGTKWVGNDAQACAVCAGNGSLLAEVWTAGGPDAGAAMLDEKRDDQVRDYRAAVNDMLRAQGKL